MLLKSLLQKCGEKWRVHRQKCGVELGETSPHRRKLVLRSARTLQSQRQGGPCGDPMQQSKPKRRPVRNRRRSSPSTVHLPKHFPKQQTISNSEKSPENFPMSNASKRWCLRTCPRTDGRHPNWHIAHRASWATRWGRPSFWLHPSIAKRSHHRNRAIRAIRN